MSNATSLLEQLTDEDAVWLLECNEERQVAAGEVVIAAGQPIDAMYLVFEGVLGVVAEAGEPPVAIIGAGEIVGEMSFVERETPSRTVEALEASTLLVVAHDALHERAERDTGFAARLYRALAVMLSQRLRRASSEIAARGAAEFQDEAEQAAWDQVTSAVDVLKDRLHAINTTSMKRGGDLPAETAGELDALITGLYTGLEQAIGDAAPGSEQFKQQVGIRVQRELVPFVLLTKVCARTYVKPRGYAGDFLAIEWMYAAEPGGVPPLGPLLDTCLLELPASLAVRNRRALLAEQITGVVEARDGQTAHVTSLACGPAREVFDVFEQLPARPRLKATLVDFDLQALAHVSERRDRLGLQRSIALTPANLIHLALGRNTIDLEDQDLVYSIGLIDYFPDHLVVKLMSLIHSLLRPGGKVILGNFHTSNMCKAFMDHVLDWRLIHRDEADMDRLYRESAFGRDCTNIRFEGQGINLFAECVKE